jgi:hypothetical protein
VLHCGLQFGQAGLAGEPEFPPGVRKKDEFGEVETHRKLVVVSACGRDANFVAQTLLLRRVPPT